MSIVQSRIGRAGSARSELNNMFCEEFTLAPEDNPRLANLCGQFDEHLRHIERRLSVEISSRGSWFKICGEENAVISTVELLRILYEQTSELALSSEHVHLHLQDSKSEEEGDEDAVAKPETSIRTTKGLIKARGINQANYLRQIHQFDLTFGIGPAGTGKTYLAVACAVHALQMDRISRLVLVRPAVEAGERLGFLPGDLAQKVDPYLRPLYDALYEMMGFERVEKLIERNVIEVAPLAYMRGRTLNESFIIMDEAQNTSVEQMKMFLTRIGFGSTAVVTGDVTQIDLPKSQRSGLVDVMDVLRDIEGVAFTHFQAKDVVRHPLVRRIVMAYQKHEAGGSGRGKN